MCSIGGKLNFCGTIYRNRVECIFISDDPNFLSKPIAIYVYIICMCVVGSIKKTDQKISEFLQEMQALGIGDSMPPPLQPVTAALPNGGVDAAASTSSPQTDEREAGVVTEDPFPTLTPKEKALMAEWVPLGLNFGIPLFSLDANSSLCDKVNI